MNFDTDLMVQAAVLLISVAGTGFLAFGYRLLSNYIGTLVQSKTSLEAERLAQRLVEAAEQMFTENSDKYEYVVDVLKARYPELDYAFLEGLIEAGVFSLKQWADIGSASNDNSVPQIGMGEKVG